MHKEKKLKNCTVHIRLFLLNIVLLTSACVSDDSFFNEEDSGVITSSVAMVTVLNKFYSGNNFFDENKQCFKFIYPITLGYNTDSSIRLDNYEGLAEVVSSQSTNFNITGIQFPVKIVYKGSDEEVLINGEPELLEVLRECQFDTIRDDFDRFFKNCFKLDYPITLLNSDRREVELATNDEFQDFYDKEGVNYQPVFKFPISVFAAPDFNSMEIHTYYGFYRIIESCKKRCLELEFTSEVMNPFNLRYKFSASSSNPNITDVYNWYVGDQLVGVGNDQENSVLFYNFEAPGTYDVCVKTDTDVCSEGVEFCKKIEVPSLCPELSFEYEKEQGTLTYTFSSNFDGMSDFRYKWYVDNELVQEDGGANGDHMFITDLTPGKHMVCIKALTPSCQELTEFCKEIEVVSICPSLDFAIEQEGNTPSYNFIASFENIDIVNYVWVINGDTIEEDGGANGDNTLFFQFAAGTHEVCIKAVETSTCPNEVQFCETLIVE